MVLILNKNEMQPFALQALGLDRSYTGLHVKVC